MLYFHDIVVEVYSKMFDSPPDDSKGTIEWSWEDFEPLYAALIKRSVGDPADFLADWTRLDELVEESFSRLHVATTVNTADSDSEKRYHDFLDSVYAKAEQAEQQLKNKFLEQHIIPAGFELPFEKMRSEAELFRENNLPLLVEERKLENQYDKIVGAQTVKWQDQEVTVAQLRPFFQSPDRVVRERAWRVAVQRQLQDVEAINNLWAQFLRLRIKLASNAGFSDYRSFRWKQLQRFDYSPHDCRLFHDAIERVVVPAAALVCERRRKALKLETLRPWDLDVDPKGRLPLAPFKTTSELKAKTSLVFRLVDPLLGDYFDTMIREDLLDLDNRKNKAPGGYCTEFAAAKRPFIFMNAVGLHDDVQTMLHEAGHAFHTFEKSRLPYYHQRQTPMEFAEVASMSMELLAAQFLGGQESAFYSLENAARARVEHLERGILFWPYMAVVDAFQHWVYENPEDAEKQSHCDAQWARIWNRFMPWIDWSGLEQELMTGWQRKLHIHTVPFYYVEYGLAQLGAVQIWENSLSDLSGAVSDYLCALSLGGTVPLPDLYRAAGAKFAFDAQVLGQAVSLMERTIDELNMSGA
jgi:oligoendopeptidase F